MDDKFLSSDSDKSLTEEGMNLSLTVASQSTMSELRGLSSREVQQHHGECSPSPDADVSSNCGTDDSAESSVPSDGILSGMTPVTDMTETAQSLRGSSSEGTAVTEILDPNVFQEKDELPYPLNNETLEQALAELPAGARLAARTCIDCWRSNKFPTRELLSFLRSIAEHSSVLSNAFGSPRGMGRGINAAKAGGAPTMGAIADARPQGFSSGAPREGASAQGPMEVEPSADEVHGEKRKRTVSLQAIPHDSAMLQQGQAAAPKLKVEPAAADGGGGHAGRGGGQDGSASLGRHSQAYDQAKITAELRERNSGFNAGDRLKKIIPKLCQMLPSAKEQEALLRHIRDYLGHKTTPERFAEEMKLLVDAHQIVVRNDEADIPKGPRCIWLPPTTPDGRARRATTTLIQCDSTEPRPHAHAAHAVPAHHLAARKRSKLLEAGPIAAVPVPAAAASVWAGRPVAAVLAASPLQQHCPLCATDPLLDNRWVQCDGCGRYFHSVCARHIPAATGFKAPFFCPRSDCRQLASMHGSLPPPPSVWDMLDTPLGNFLTNKARAASRSGQLLAVKVLSDIFRSPAPPLSNSFPFRSKAVFAYQRLASGAEVTLFGMYVHEYGYECLPPNAGRAYVQCIDSTPLYGPEQGDERQEILTAIVSGYFEYAREVGFKHVHLHVPPPTDECAFIFTSRSINVRIRACMHLAHWYRRVLEASVQNGSIYTFHAGSCITALNFPPSLLETSEAAAEASFRTCTAGAGHLAMQLQGCQQSMDLMQHIAALTERFFVVNLLPAGAYSPSSSDFSPLIPSVYAATRHDFVMLCQKESLHFHSLAHAQYSTALLASRIVDEQRQLQLLDRPDSTPPLPTKPRGHQAAAAGTARFGDADGAAARVGERSAHWMSGMSAPARRAPAQRQPDMSRGAGGGWPAQQQQQQQAAASSYSYGSAYADYQEPARAREGDLRRYAGEPYDEEDNEGEDAGEVEGLSPAYEYDGLDSGPAGGRAYDRMGSADAEESGAYMPPPAPGPAPVYGRGGAAPREEAGRGGCRGAGKEVADWFSVLVNAEEQPTQYGYQSMPPSKSSSPSAWTSYPAPAPYET